MNLYELSGLIQTSAETPSSYDEYIWFYSQKNTDRPYLLDAQEWNSLVLAEAWTRLCDTW